MTQNPFDSQEFRKELGDVLDEKLKPFGKLAGMVEAHEAALNQSKGARWAFNVLWAAIVVFAEYLFHRGK